MVVDQSFWNQRPWVIGLCASWTRNWTNDWSRTLSPKSSDSAKIAEWSDLGSFSKKNPRKFLNLQEIGKPFKVPMQTMNPVFGELIKDIGEEFFETGRNDVQLVTHKKKCLFSEMLVDNFHRNRLCSLSAAAISTERLNGRAMFSGAWRPKWFLGRPSTRTLSVECRSFAGTSS